MSIEGSGRQHHNKELSDLTYYRLWRADKSPYGNPAVHALAVVIAAFMCSMKLETFGVRNVYNVLLPVFRRKFSQPDIGCEVEEEWNLPETKICLDGVLLTITSSKRITSFEDAVATVEHKQKTETAIIVRSKCDDDSLIPGAGYFTKTVRGEELIVCSRWAEKQYTLVKAGNFYDAWEIEMSIQKCGQNG